MSTSERSSSPTSQRAPSSGSDVPSPRSEVPGREADKPTEIPAKGWFQILKRSYREISNDHLTLVAGGVAYSWFMALFPGLIAGVLIYGLVTSPSDVTSQVSNMASGLSHSAQSLLTTQLKSITKTHAGGASIGLIISIALALWSASAGMAGLVEALNIAYDEDEERNFVVKRGLALLLTIGFIIFLGVAVALVAVFPIVLSNLGTGIVVTILAQIARVVILVGAAVLALGLLYRVGPDRDAPAVKWLSLGSVIATVIWLLASLAFSFYVNNFGSYGKTYGALAGVVVLLLWLYITALVVLLGAEINAETEAQTAKDTTKGPEQPMGTRGAVKADEPPPAE
jgi:membrane protein